MTQLGRARRWGRSFLARCCSLTPALLFVFALAIRLVGLHWGGQHSDENFGASAKVLTGQLVPDFHYYPPLLDYINACAYAGMFAVGYLTGFWPDTAAFRQQYFDDITPFIVVGRLPTIVAGAACAPLAWALARQLGADRRGAVAVAIAAGLLPIHVLLSHFSKSDIAMATGFVGMAATYLRALERRDTLSVLWFAAACAVAVSFKHSAALFVAPLTTVYFVLQLQTRERVSEAFALSAWWGGTFAAVWVPLNIGILLDAERFIEFQRLQALLASRSVDIATLWHVTLPRLASDTHGASWAVLLLWLVSPVLQPTFRYVSLWGALLGTVIWVALTVGSRVTDGLFVAHITLMVVMACSALVAVPVRLTWARHAPIAAVLLVAGSYAADSWDVKRQALAESQLDARVTQAVLSVATPGETRVLSAGPPLLYPTDPTVVEEERQRHERLALKYGVELPPLSAEKRRKSEPATEDDRTPLYVRSMPYVFGGLEVYEESEVTNIQPFAWPPQPEEYSLDYWLAQGFEVFVVANEAAYLASDSRFYRERHAEIRERCRLIEALAPERPLFFESEVRVYGGCSEPPAVSGR